MKRKIGKISIIAVCVVAFLSCAIWFISIVQAIPRSASRDSLTLANAQLTAQYGVSGDVFFVDSAVTGGTAATTWGSAAATLQIAIDLCTDNNNDLILIAAGHAETMGNQSVVVDCPGVKIEALGSGALKARFTFDTSTDEFAVSAANVHIKGLRFETSVTGVVSGFTVETGGDDCIIEDCYFGHPVAATFAERDADEFICALYVAVGANRVVVDNCYFNASDSDGSVSAIQIQAVSGFVLKNSRIQGDYTTACIMIGTEVSAGEESDEVIIIDNILFSGTMRDNGEIGALEVIQASTLTSGLVANNTIVSDVASALLMRVADSMVFMNNIVSDTDGDEFSGSPEWGVIYQTTGSGAVMEGDTTSISPHVDG